jgi:sterol desaturase/sphingolipid hydroxylase (fatty acid hydroxylase superfamily)
MQETALLSFKLALVLIGLILGKPVMVLVIDRLARTWGSRHGFIVSTPVRPEQTATERRSIYLVLTDPVVLALLVSSGALRLAPDTWFNAALTFAVMFLWVDMWMYGNHWAMHRFAFLTRWHVHHHRSRVPQPSSALSFSFMEKLVCYTLGWLLAAAALSWWVPISLYGIAAFYAFYFSASSIAHSNFEFFHRGADPTAFRVLGSATTHALHHVRPRCNLGFFTTLYDRLLGTAASAAQAAAVLPKEHRA